MRISIRTTDLKDEAVSFIVNETDTVADLKGCVQEKLGIEPFYQILVLNKARLDDEAMSLVECGIVEGSKMIVLKKGMRTPRLAITASNDRTAKLWDVASGECTQTFSGHSTRVTSAVLSADGALALTASDDETAKLWDVASGECTQTFSGHSGTVESADLSADGA